MSFDINSLTLGQIKEIAALLPCAANPVAIEPYEVGEKVLIRLVTTYVCGRIIGVYSDTLVLDQASWIPDTGRFSDALEKATFNEVEPARNGKKGRRARVGRGAIVDVWDLDEAAELPETKR